MINKIIYFGSHGSFSNIAAMKFDDCVTLSSCLSLPALFKKISLDKFSLGVIPIENTLHGRVVESYDLLNKNNLFIISEVVLRINHCLLTFNGPASPAGRQLSIDTVKFCYSHYQAFSQCKKFFESHSNMTQIMVNDTATAAKELSKTQDTKSAVVASKKAAEIYGLHIYKQHLEDHSDNFTRFAVISNEVKTGGEKASILFSVKHIPGSLSLVLSFIASKKFNLTTIESRPIEGKPWEYRFFVDLTKPAGGDFNRLITDLRVRCETIKLLGIYSKSPIYET